MAKRRGFGKLRRLPSKRWQASYIGADQERHVAPVTFTAEGDAESWLNEERKLLESGDWTSPAAREAARQAQNERDSLTLDDFVSRLWLPTLDLRPATSRDYESLMKNHIRGERPKLGDLPLASITRADVRAWWASMDASKPRARSKAFQLLHNIMNGAVDLELLDVNPAVLPSRTKVRTKRATDVEPFTVEQLQTTADAMPPRLRMAVLLGGWCGLRYGELSELRRSDLYLDQVKVPAELRKKVTAPALHVSRGVIKVKGGYEVGPPKTAAGVRWVHLPAHLVPDLKEHLKLHAAFGRDGLLFPAPNGGHLHANSFARLFTKAATAADRPKATPHVLRYTGVSLTHAAGGTIADNMKRHGHATPAMSLHYAHSMEGADADVAQKLAKLGEGKKK
ncbi:tyrosine-type recombinase/integrase [Propioniciclava sp. MC1683]|uniref:tyrosine-type recombinase/integrase n=1 Tax=Propioniciclava sp. MC1683 TaxID=2760309 RepID=UPI001603C652|nr:tyrosine-type recombinase/integrase [Propioniciclava sp. MC1683]MBB1502268.1 tyrosine-type recombinase/integrase [Propioniciclava sp. MC1683]